MQNEKLEKGQILYILAIALVALFGFTALAIDGTNIYNERRKDQSTADSAALAGAGAASLKLKTADTSSFTCSGFTSTTYYTAAINAAVASAAEDNVSLTTDTSSGTGLTVTCGISNGTYYIDVQTLVTSSVKTYFLKVITNKANTTSVESIARVYLNKSFAGGNEIYSTGTNCKNSKNADSSNSSDGGIFSTGDAVINVKNGGIFSSSCVAVEGSSRIYAYNGLIQYYGQGAYSFYAGSQAETTGSNGIIFGVNDQSYILNDLDTSTSPSISDILSSTSYQLWGSGNPYTANASISQAFWPVPSTITYPHKMESMTTPTCPTTVGTIPTMVSGTHSYTLQPGTYSSISWDGWGGNTLTFTPGTYCVSGSITLNGGPDTIIMNNTVIYLTGSGNFSYGGSDSFTENTSTIYITNGAFDLGSGCHLNANNLTVYIKSGSFTIEGNATGTLSGPSCGTSACGVGPSIEGVLLYMDDSNTSNVNIIGSSSLAMNGTLYAPNSNVDITGYSGAKALNVQIIGRKVWVDGSSTINMDQDAATLYSQGSTTINLLK